MENKINIADILLDKPQGTKLYSPIFGEVDFNEICHIDGETTICVIGNNYFHFLPDGRYSLSGECLLFPSKSMRDWSKFAWKKGDILVSDDGRKETIFDGFTNDAYTSFRGKHSLDDNCYEGEEYIGDEDGLATQDYSLESKDAAQIYIKHIEERLGGKLNMETLEIKKPEFKEGDIVKHNDNTIVLVKKCE